jgi:hypothetical protein
MKKPAVGSKELKKFIRTLSENKNMKIEEIRELFTTPQQKETVSLRELSEMFYIPLWKLMGWSSKRRFPDFIKAERRTYEPLAISRYWWLKKEVKLKIALQICD